MSDIRFDADLIRRYDLNVPPYITYPAPPHFHSSFDVLAYRRAALLSNAGLKAFAVDIHIPPRTEPERMPEYLQCLQREIKLQSELFDPRRPITQLYISGEATLLNTAALQQLLEHMDRYFRFAPEAERELCIDINPRAISAPMIQQFAALGFRCANFRTPEATPAGNLDRQSFDAALQLIDTARDSGFGSVGFDLIYGRPLQTRQEFAQLLEGVIASRPDRLATYSYPHVPELQRAQRSVHERHPSAATRLGLRQLAMETLTRAGYVDLGMDRFAWPEQSAGYPADVKYDLLGIGAGAVGRMGIAYAQNAKQLTDYCQTLQRHVLPIECGVELTVDDVVRREVIQRIMCQRELDFAVIANRYALDFHSYFAPELRQLRTLADDGLVIDSGTGFAVSARGHLLLQNITTVFDAYRRLHTSEPRVA